MTGHHNSEAPLDMRRLSSPSILCVIVIVSVMAWVTLTVLLRLLPVFIEHGTVFSAMESLATNYVRGQDQSGHSGEALRKAWSVNRVSQVDVFKVPSDTRRLDVILTLEYQTVFPLVGRIQGILDFGAAEMDGR